MSDPVSGPDSGLPRDAAAPWQHGKPWDVPNYAVPQADIPGSPPQPSAPQPYEDWPRSAPQSGAPQPYEDWPPGAPQLYDESPPSASQPYTPESYPPQPYADWQHGQAPPAAPQSPPGRSRHAAHGRSGGSHGRSITIAGLVAAVVVAGGVVANVNLSPGGHQSGGADRSGGSAAAGRPPAVTKAEAQRVMANYTTVNNKANQQWSNSLLGTIEGDSSYAMDTGNYRFLKAQNPSNHFPAFGPLTAAYYIPDQSVHAPFPHWFVVDATFADLSAPKRPAFSGYVVFSQASAGAPWLNVSEPDMMPGGTTAPQIATNAQGLAIAVSPDPGANGLSIAPGQIGTVTATSMDHQSTAAVKLPPNLSKLTDQSDKAFWQSRIPAGSTESLTHQAGTGPVFGLQTTNGGAILFYYVTAQLNLVPPAGSRFNLQVPGFYSAGVPVTSARLPYIDQFATYDPPKGQAGPRITADASGYAGQG